MNAGTASVLSRWRARMAAALPGLVGLGNAVGADGLPVRLSTRTYAGTRDTAVRELGFDQPLLWSWWGCWPGAW